MGFFVFLLLLLLLVAASYTIVKVYFRRYTPLELVLKLRMLSSHGSSVVWQDSFGHVPSTWFGWDDIRKFNSNLAIMSAMADHCRRHLPPDADEVDRAEMRFIHKAFLEKRAGMLKNEFLAAVEICFGRIACGRNCPRMAAIARNFTDASLMIIDMVEMAEKPLVSELEGRILHGT